MASTSTKAAATKSILTPATTLKAHEKQIRSISYFPDGQRIISGSDDKTARQWDLKAGKELDEARGFCENEVLAVAVSRDGRWVVTGGGDDYTGELKACEVETGIVKTFEGHSARIECIDISTNNKLLASGSADSTARIWNLETGELVAGPFKSVNHVSAVRLSMDSMKLAIISAFGMCLRVWDIQKKKLDASIGKPGGWIHIVITMMSMTYAHAPIFWTNNDKTILAAFNFIKNGGHANIAKTIYEFDASTLETVGTFEGHTKAIDGLALSSDNTLLASSSWDGTIKLWSFESRLLLASFDIQNPGTLALSPDSRQLAYTYDENNANIYICDTPPSLLAQARASARKKLTLNDPLNPDATRRPTAVRRSPPIPVTPMVQRPRELLLSSSRTDTVLPVHNDESGRSPIEAMLPNLTAYITKDDEYPVAHGGFGEIWKCSYSIDRRLIKVAVKALRVNTADQLGPARAKKIKRITRELRICAKLKHKNILPVYGYTFNFGPLIALVSPWAESGNLSSYLEREGADLTVLRRFQILRDIIAGLQYLHANSVIHGDFTTPNVLIHGDGTACVADFGLSLMYSEVMSISQASWTSTLNGNVRWMAPELLTSEREDGSLPRPSEQSDIYSLGGIMLQVLTNSTPYYYFRHDAAIVWAMQKSEMPSRSRYPPLPDKYWEFIEKCWSTDPQERPSTEAAEGVIRNEYYALSRSP